eukprot:SAG22_NODE_2198_length_2849_cov_1.186182_1_plen_390_part_00
MRPFAAGFDNKTGCGHGTDKHNIYFQYTALHHNGAAARSAVGECLSLWPYCQRRCLSLLLTAFRCGSSNAGTEADVELMKKLYVEDWWVEALASRDEFHGIWHRNFFTHNYEVRGLTGLTDLYVMTGNRTYLAAALGGWAMLRESWQHVGGSLAINENTYYPPKSYYLSYTSMGGGRLEPPPPPPTSALAAGTGSGIAGFRAEAGVFCDTADKGAAVLTATAAACAARVLAGAFGFQWDCNGTRPKPCIVLQSAAQCSSLRPSGCHSVVYINQTAAVPPRRGLPPPPPPPTPPAPAFPEGPDHPTGELCGSAFFVQLNTKLHALFPENETFAAEIEKTILNVGMAAIDGAHNGRTPVGIRYFANMHKSKQLPGRVATCCENSGTHLLGK